MKLITHNGPFHADEVMACAILKGLNTYTNAKIFRTRDANIINSASATVGDVVFDVGMIYDPDNNKFDHHMGSDNPTKPYRSDGTPYSSVGLVWEKFGQQYLEDNFSDISDDIGTVWNKIDRSVILKIDKIDNGVGDSFNIDDLTALINDYNLAWDEDTSLEDEAFIKATEFAAAALNRRIAAILSRERALGTVLKAIDTSTDPRFVVLPQSMPWQGAVFDTGKDDLLYVIYPRDKSWYCTAVPSTKGSFDKRKPFPAHWSGLQDDDLVLATRVNDAVFCHAALFVCAARSKEGIMNMVQQALEYENEPELVM